MDKYESIWWIWSEKQLDNFTRIIPIRKVIGVVRMWTANKRTTKQISKQTIVNEKKRKEKRKEKKYEKKKRNFVQEKKGKNPPSTTIKLNKKSQLEDKQSIFSLYFLRIDPCDLCSEKNIQVKLNAATVRSNGQVTGSNFQKMNVTCNLRT